MIPQKKPARRRAVGHAHDTLLAPLTATQIFLEIIEVGVSPGALTTERKGMP